MTDLAGAWPLFSVPPDQFPARIGAPPASIAITTVTTSPPSPPVRGAKPGIDLVAIEGRGWGSGQALG